MTALPVAESGYRLAVGDVQTLPISLVRSPQHSVIAALLASAAAPCAGAAVAAPRAVQRARRGIDLSRALRPGARFALDPMVGSLRHALVPEVSVPVPPLADVSVREQVSRMYDASDELAAELAGYYGGSVPGFWQPALERPRAWFRSLARASEDTWSVLAGPWRDAGALLDREVRRVGTAVVRGGVDVLLGSLHPRLRYRDGVLTMATRSGRRCAMHQLRGHRLVLVPMVGRPDQLLANFDDDGVSYIAYPLPAAAGPRPAGSNAARGAVDALALLLGPLRARALRLLARPMTVGQLATRLQCALNTATYHCDQLQAAGLINREREGRSVRVSRTMRGSELVDLMA